MALLVLKHRKVEDQKEYSREISDISTDQIITGLFVFL